jgi:hypothetical protein
MPTVGEEYDKKYGKSGRSSKMRTMIATEEDKKKKAKTMPKTGIPGGKPPKSPMSPDRKKKAKKKKGVIEGIKGYFKKIESSMEERTGSPSMRKKHYPKRRKK